MPDGDRALRLSGLVQRGVGSDQDAGVGRLRQPPLDRIVETEHAILDQAKRERPADRLGHRGDAKERVLFHRRTMRLDGHPAAGVRFSPAIQTNRCHVAGNPARRHLRVERFPDVVELAVHGFTIPRLHAIGPNRASCSTPASAADGVPT